MLTKHFAALFLAASPIWCQPQVIATGLPGAQKLILTPSGNFLVSEPSTTPNAGRVSFVTRGGVRRTLLDGLPTGIEVTMAGASGPSAMALRERTLYLAFGPGDSERRGPPPTSMHNPQGASSPIFSSILEFRFSVEPDSLAGAFRMTPAHQQTLGDGGEVELTDGSGGTARVSLLARFPVSEPSPNVVYRFSNPWGMALTKDGRSLYVTDASTNALARIDTATGRWRRITRFPPVSNPAPVGPPVIDIVPTSVRLYGDELLISFLTGFPFAPGNARILSLNPETGTTNPFIFGLTSATDVLWRMLPDGASQFFVLEFSANQSASPAPPGRLLRFDASGMQVLAAPLITPVSMAYDEAAKELFILELRGQILRLRLE